MTDIKTLIEARAAADPRLKAVLKKIKEGTATFKDTAYYAEVYSSITGKVFSANVLDLVETEREEVCEELLRGNYEEINNICAQVQTALDEAAGIHIKPQRAAFPTDRVDQIAHSILDPTVKDSVIKRRANTGVANVSQGFHDSYIKVNASFRNDSGLKVYINRETDGKCCEWCTKIAGRYSYGTEPDDIYRRHDNCGCTVTYENGKQRQDVWSKRSWTAPEVGAGAPPPTRFSPEQAVEIQVRNMPKRLTNGQRNGIIRSITVDDFELRSYGKNIDEDVLSELLSEIKQCEKSGNFVFSDILFDSLGGNEKGTFALQTEMLPNGLIRLNVNTDVFSGRTLEEINERFAKTDSILANNLHEAMLHERGHAKLMKGRSASNVEKIHNSLENEHIEGISECAYSDGSECIAETEILLEKKIKVPDKARELYNKYVKG